MVRLFVLYVFIEQVRQFTLQHIGIADIQLNQALQMRGAVDVDVVTVQAQALFSNMTGFYFHADFDIGSG